MEINNIFTIEVEGMCKTIIHYTNDEYVKSYAHQLMGLKFPKDTGKIKLLVDRLYDWYSLEIDRIKESEYILNKHSHIKSYQLIEDAKIQLDRENGVLLA